MTWGRIPLFIRTRIHPTLTEAGWYTTVAGNSVRYRRRIRAFDRLTMISRILGWDARFAYVDHSLWKGRECANQLLTRMAFVSAEGIVAPTAVMAKLGHEGPGPTLPDWVAAWIAAEAQRPWPPAAGAHLPAG